MHPLSPIQPLVLDLGYSTFYSSMKSVRDMQKQVINLYAINRSYHEPFHLFLRNVSSESPGKRESMNE